MVKNHFKNIIVAGSGSGNKNFKINSFYLFQNPIDSSSSHSQTIHQILSESSTSFWDILFRNKQTNRPRWKHNLCPPSVAELIIQNIKRITSLFPAFWGSSGGEVKGTGMPRRKGGGDTRLGGQTKLAWKNQGKRLRKTKFRIFGNLIYASQQHFVFLVRHAAFFLNY